MVSPLVNLSHCIGDPREHGCCEAVTPTFGFLGKQGDVASSDSFSFYLPQERRVYVAIPPTFGPLEGGGDGPTPDFVAVHGQPREGKGYVAKLPTLGPLRRQGWCRHLSVCPIVLGIPENTVVAKL